MGSSSSNPSRMTDTTPPQTTHQSNISEDNNTKNNNKHNTRDTTRKILQMCLPRWQPDDEAPSCLLCKRPFGLIVRRHHCRACGKVICCHCSQLRLKLPRFDYHTPVRVCDRCWIYETLSVHNPYSASAVQQNVDILRAVVDEPSPSSCAPPSSPSSSCDVATPPSSSSFSPSSSPQPGQPSPSEESASSSSGCCPIPFFLPRFFLPSKRTAKG